MTESAASAPFKHGDRIMLVSMGDDPDPITPNTLGTVVSVTEFALGPGGVRKEFQVGVDWDNGRRLSVVVPPDQIVKIG